MPAAQWLHGVDESRSSSYQPDGHSTQCVAATPAYSPASQSMHSPWNPAAGTKNPAGHNVHVMRSAHAASWNVPASHGA